MLKQLLYYFLASLCCALVYSQECFLPRNRANCEECAAEGLDLSTGCTTCVSPLSIECEEGEQNCAVGNFVFSAQFHSYQNPTHMCAECSDSGPVTCESVDRGLNCGLRFIYCLQPYGSQAFDSPLVVQSRFGSGTDNETFVGNFFIQGNTGSLTPHSWNRSNPFSREFTLWPGRTQFAIVVYNIAGGAPEPRVVDRVLIDLELNISSSFIERRTYSGVNNFSHFDMSFRIDGECGDNYYGPQCSIFCGPEEGVFTCDSEGNRVCVNRVLDPAMNCTQCLDTDRDPEDNCGVTTMQTTTEANFSTSTASMSSFPVDDGNGTLIGAMVGGVVGGVLLVIISVLLVVIVCAMGRKEKSNKQEAAQDEEKIENQVYGVNEGSPNSPAAAQDEEKIEMTRNQVYGVREAAGGGDIVMKANVVYGVNVKSNTNPDDDSYDCL